MAGEAAADELTEAHVPKTDVPEIDVPEIDVPEIDVHSAVCEALAEVATDVDIMSLDADADLYEEVGLDSMDLLDLAVGVRDRIGVEIAERDYPKLTSVNAVVAHVQSLMR